MLSSVSVAAILLPAFALAQGSYTITINGQTTVVTGLPDFASSAIDEASSRAGQTVPITIGGQVTSIVLPGWYEGPSPTADLTVPPAATSDVTAPDATDLGTSAVTAYTTTFSSTTSTLESDAPVVPGISNATRTAPLPTGGNGTAASSTYPAAFTGAAVTTTVGQGASVAGVMALLAALLII
ncbi:MAG: hypothetical protein M1837_002576 [Sclerophora amabilis]|nr:MAG: hypothetical protein M1837_002576 [Sclerophora amabilis]